MQNKSLYLYLAVRANIGLAIQMVTVAFGWQMYSLTKMPLYLGLVGLVQFLPLFLLTLVVGYVADRFDRRRILTICQLIESAGIFLLAFASLNGWITKEIILVTVFFIGAVNAFQHPTMQALLPNVVSKEMFPKAAAWSASVFQTAVIIGPAIGGLLFSIKPEVVYFISGTIALVNSIIVCFIKVDKAQAPREPVNIKSLFAGITFIKSKPIILGAISLDMFAVLFGGATALLPVYAAQILSTGPLGLGLLRSAPAAGAVIMSAILARRQLKEKVGHTMFAAVAVYGLATIGFGLSRSFALSIFMLVVLGASDVISVVVRHTLVQLETPDNMRGRVSSVNSMFIGTSNQLGEFESGITAAWFGVVPAVVLGGIGTIFVVMLWTRVFPTLYNTNKFE